MADIADKVAQIRQAVYGKDVRESIASGIEAINTDAENAVNIANNAIPTMNQIKTDTQALKDATQVLKDQTQAIKDQIPVENATAEIIDARGGFDTLRHKLDSYVVNVKDFGAKGDDTTNDYQSILDVISYIKSIGGGCLYFPKGIYKISANSPSLLIDFSNIYIIGAGVDNTILKFYTTAPGRSAWINIQGTNGDIFIQNITIRDLTIDGTQQLNKGGTLADNYKTTIPNPEELGSFGINIEYAAHINIENIKLNDIYGDGIHAMYTAFCIVDNCQLFDCSAANIQSGETGYDNFGDGIAFFASHNIIVKNNKVINKRIFKIHAPSTDYSYFRTDVADIYNYPCGRSGLEYEYAINADMVEPPLNCAPYYNDFSERNHFGSIFENNYVYGYNKGIHIENLVKTTLFRNTIIHCHISILLSSNNVQCLNNYLDNDNVTPALQSGYNLYYGGIAVTNFGVNENILIDGNSFYGDGQGIILGSGNVIITNNNFWCKEYQILNVIYEIENIHIISNIFHPTNTNYYSISIDSIYNTKIIDNIYYGTSDENCELNLASLNGCIIEENSFISTYIKFDANASKVYIENNTFRGNTSKTSYIYFYVYTDIFIKSNVFNMGDNITKCIDGISTATNITIEENIINSTSINKTAFSLKTNLYNIKVLNNKMYCTDNTSYLLYCDWDIYSLIVKYNFIDNGYILYTAGGNLRNNGEIRDNSGLVHINSTNVTIPTEGTHDIGERIYIPNPIAGGYEGYICVTAGTPGTWKGFGAIQA